MIILLFGVHNFCTAKKMVCTTVYSKELENFGVDKGSLQIIWSRQISTPKKLECTLFHSKLDCMHNAVRIWSEFSLTQDIFFSCHFWDTNFFWNVLILIYWIGLLLTQEERDGEICPFFCSAQTSLKQNQERGMFLLWKLPAWNILWLLRISFLGISLCLLVDKPILNPSALECHIETTTYSCFLCVPYIPKPFTERPWKFHVLKEKSINYKSLPFFRLLKWTKFENLYQKLIILSHEKTKLHIFNFFAFASRFISCICSCHFKFFLLVSIGQNFTRKSSLHRLFERNNTFTCQKNNSRCHLNRKVCWAGPYKTEDTVSHWKGNWKMRELIFGKHLNSGIQHFNTAFWVLLNLPCWINQVKHDCVILTQW